MIDHFVTLDGGEYIIWSPVQRMFSFKFPLYISKSKISRADLRNPIRSALKMDNRDMIKDEFLNELTTGTPIYEFVTLLCDGITEPTIHFRNLIHNMVHQLGKEQLLQLTAEVDFCLVIYSTQLQ